MKPLGLKLFAWRFVWGKVRGKWRETIQDRIVGRYSRMRAKVRATRDQLP